MIVYDLTCEREHRFEAWFGCAEDFERQKGSPMLTCPMCGNAEIRRVPSSVHVGRSRTEEEAPRPAPPAEGPGHQRHVTAFQDPRELMDALRRVVEDTENVGQRFPEEARKIHYGEAPKRSIRGQASREDADALREEGIEVVSLPFPVNDDLH